MSIYFDRTLPLFLTDEPTYNGVAVDVDVDSLQMVIDLNALVKQMAEAITETGSPEDYNQELAEMFTAGLKEIWESNYGPTIIVNDSADSGPSFKTTGD